MERRIEMRACMKKITMQYTFFFNTDIQIWCSKKWNSQEAMWGHHLYIPPAPLGEQQLTLSNKPTPTGTVAGTPPAMATYLNLSPT